MKIKETEVEVFKPLTITLESPEELDHLVDIIGVAEEAMLKKELHYDYDIVSSKRNFLVQLSNDLCDYLTEEVPF